MNGLPNVSITIGNYQLGRTATTDDGVAGLVIPATAKPNLPLYTPKQIFSLKEAETLGLTEANDATEHIDAWRQIKEYFDLAGTGAELYFMTYPMERTMTEMCDPTNTSNNSIRTLLDYAGGRITLLGIGRYISSSIVYAQTNTGGIDSDVHAAMLKINTMALEYADNIQPFSAFIDCRGWTGVIADLMDMRTYSYKKVTPVLCGTKGGVGSAAIGAVLGRFAKIPVQRSPARVKDGGLNIVTATFTNGQRIENFSKAQMDAIHDKGYLFIRKFTGLSGYYFNDDPTATAQNDDFLSVTNNRVMDKALRLLYGTYVLELGDEISITTDGKIAPSQVAYLQQVFANALQQQMVNQGNISGFEVYIDPSQNVISTDSWEVQASITPVGHTKKIVGLLKFKNPSTPIV